MSPELILLAEQAAIGAVLGAVGQLARAMIGLNKRIGSETPMGPASFVMLRFVVTMAIGAIAGAAGGLLLLGEGTKLGAQAALTLVAIGYAGADVIEGLMQRYLPQAQAQTPQAPAA